MKTATRTASIRLPRWWLFSIIAVQVSLATFEALLAYGCHHDGGECWPFFLIFTLNLPLSVLLSDLIGELPRLMGIAPYGDALTIATGVVYALGGTLWWIGISTLGKAAWLGLMGIARLSAPRGSGDV